MGLWLLSGPTPLFDSAGDGSTYMNFLAWWPHIGLIAQGSFPTSSGRDDWVITLDGGCEAQAWHWSGASHLSYWPEKKRLVSILSGGGEYVYEPKAFFKQTTDPATWLTADESGIMWIYPYVKFPDKWVWFYSSRVRETRHNGLPPVAVGPTFPFSSADTLPGRTETEVLLSGYVNVSGHNIRQLQFFDTVRNEPVGPPMWIDMPHRDCFFAPEFGVFVTSHLDEPGYPGYSIRVWSMETRPVTVGPVTVLRGMPKSGQVVHLQTHVTGSMGEPCEGELIDWTLTGVGELLDPQTKVEADGYAKTRVHLRVGETGDFTLNASLAC